MELIAYSSNTDISSNTAGTSNDAVSELLESIGKGFEIYDKSVVTTSDTASIVWILRKEL